MLVLLCGIASWFVLSVSMPGSPKWLDDRTILAIIFLSTMFVYGLVMNLALIPIIKSRIPEARNVSKTKTPDSDWLCMIIGLPWLGTNLLFLARKDSDGDYLSDDTFFLISVSSESIAPDALAKMEEIEKQVKSSPENAVKGLSASVILDHKKAPLLVFQEESIYFNVTVIPKPVVKFLMRNTSR